MIRAKRIETPLPFPMTTEEYIEKAKEMSDRLLFVEEMENCVLRAKAVLDSEKGRTKEPIEEENGKIHTLNLEMRSNTVTRDGEVFEVYDYTKKMVFRRRADNGILVPGSIRKMTEKELGEPLSMWDADEMAEVLKGTAFHSMDDFGIGAADENAQATNQTPEATGVTEKENCTAVAIRGRTEVKARSYTASAEEQEREEVAQDSDGAR
jgi:hypothetical protein